MEEEPPPPKKQRVVEPEPVLEVDPANVPFHVLVPGAEDMPDVKTIMATLARLSPQKTQRIVSISQLFVDAAAALRSAPDSDA